MRLRYYGDPVLRKKAEPVLEVNDDVRAVVDFLIKVMKETNGIGIAAPQVGFSWRLFVSIVKGQDSEGTILYCDPYVLVNPEITNLSTETWEMEEGCLSIPELYIPIVRPVSCDISWYDLEGNQTKMHCEDFLARHFLHEYDHLNGILTIDRVKGKKRTALDPALRMIKKKYN
ncbi:MAG: Peptide deformylase [Chlamydiales bacterium]|nr:Peptide deformylase [Chlamydiales bacterium]MCH9635823.1 Peptide deformylase [Chlamydiales bacterium]